MVPFKGTLMVPFNGTLMVPFKGTYTRVPDYRKAPSSVAVTQEARRAASAEDRPKGLGV